MILASKSRTCGSHLLSNTWKMCGNGLRRGGGGGGGVGSPLACFPSNKEIWFFDDFSEVIWHLACAAKAIFYCPTMNSHRPRSQNTAKEQALIPEKDSKRIRPRCHVSLEKSSKKYKPLEKWAKPNLLPDVTPQPANFSGKYFRRICHVVESDPPELFAFFLATQDGQNRGEGGVIPGLI